MIRRLIALCALVLLASFIGGAAPAEDVKASGETWLALVDSQKYAESWAEAGSMFRANIKQEQWVEAVTKARQPLGKLLSRKHLNTTTTTSLPGAPDGDYAVLQFQTTFENKAQAVETLTVVMENGKYRSVGYFIK